MRYLSAALIFLSVVHAQAVDLMKEPATQPPEQRAGFSEVLNGRYYSLDGPKQAPLRLSAERSTSSPDADWQLVLTNQGDLVERIPRSGDGRRLSKACGESGVSEVVIRSQPGQSSPGDRTLYGCEKVSGSLAALNPSETLTILGVKVARDHSRTPALDFSITHYHHAADGWLISRDDIHQLGVN